GSTPSRISSSASAVHSVSATCVSCRAKRLLRGAARRRAGSPSLLEILEELGTRVDDHQVALVAERRLVRLEAAVERVELRVLRVRLRVDRRRFRAASPLELLRLPIGVGKDDLPLAIGVRADL